MSTVKKGPKHRKPRADRQSCRGKAHNERKHAERRLWERYQIVYTDQVRKALLNCIQNGNASEIIKQSNRLRKYKLLYNSILLHIVYDRKRKEIVTFLPPEEVK